MSGAVTIQPNRTPDSITDSVAAPPLFYGFGYRHHAATCGAHQSAGHILQQQGGCTGLNSEPVPVTNGASIAAFKSGLVKL